MSLAAGVEVVVGHDSRGLGAEAAGDAGQRLAVVDAVEDDCGLAPRRSAAPSSSRSAASDDVARRGAWSASRHRVVPEGRPRRAARHRGHELVRAPVEAGRPTPPRARAGVEARQQARQHRLRAGQALRRDVQRDGRAAVGHVRAEELRVEQVQVVDAGARGARDDAQRRAPGDLEGRRRQSADRCVTSSKPKRSRFLSSSATAMIFGTYASASSGHRAPHERQRPVVVASRAPAPAASGARSPCRRPPSRAPRSRTARRGRTGSGRRRRSRFSMLRRSSKSSSTARP